MPTCYIWSLATSLFGAFVALLSAVAQENVGPVKKESELLEGTWNFVSVEQNGMKQPREQNGKDFKTIMFKEDKFEIKQAAMVLQAGTWKLNLSKNPKTIDLTITEGEGKGKVQLGIYELKGDTFTVCLDPLGKKRPMKLEAQADSDNLLAVLQRERIAGVDPKDASLIYDKPHQMNTGFKAYNGRAYDVAALCVEAKFKVVLPHKETVIEWHEKDGVLMVYMEKRADILAHFDGSVSIGEIRQTMGCAVKLEKGALLVGTFGEVSFLEGATRMKLFVLVPAKVEVGRREGLIGGYGGRAGEERPAKAINPTRDDPMPALTKSKDGKPPCWLPPMDEDGWHEIPAVADPERRMSKAEKKKG